MKNLGRPPKWSKEQMENAIKAYSSGETSVRTVKDQFGIPPTSLLRYCRERNIPIKQPGFLNAKKDKHPTWKGGFRLDKDGYIRTYAPDHPWPRRGKYIHEHVRVMEIHLGRKLKSDESVHHIDGNKLNNSLDNLLLTQKGAHSRFHRHIDIVNRKRDERGRFT